MKKGTILLWPKFKARFQEQERKWKAFFIYCEIEDLDNTLSFLPVLENNKSGRLAWEVLMPTQQGRVKYLTNEKEGFPRYLVVRKNDNTDEFGAFNLALEEVNIESRNESWGIDFGTQGSIVAFSPDSEHTQPFYLRNDLSYVVLEGDEKKRKAIRNSAAWVPTYPSEFDSESEPYVLTQLAVDVEKTISRIYRKEEALPVENFNIVSLHADTREISKRLISDLKWPGTIISSESESLGRREARKAYLTLLLMMTLAERVQGQEYVPVDTINPVISYPLRMGPPDVKAYSEDFKHVCDGLLNMTGFRFNTPGTISESRAASHIRNNKEETVIADLGGGTLDLWMGKDSSNQGYEISTDSVRLGGLNLLREIAKNSFLSSKEDLKSLDKMYLQKNTDFVGGWISKRAGELKIVYSYYRELLNEYIARFILGHLIMNYKSLNHNENVNLIAVGNGWKLFGCYDEVHISTIHQWIASDVNERIKRLIRDFKLNNSTTVRGWAYKKKESVAVGAARSYNSLKAQLIAESDAIRSVAGLEFQYPDANGNDHHACWTSRIPFKFSANTKFKSDHISVRSTCDGYCYAIPPEIPQWKGKINSEICESFNAEVTAPGDVRLYDTEVDKLILMIAPFGVLSEKILGSFRDRREW